METLKDAAETLGSSESFLASSATSSDETQVGVSASEDAPRGTYQINITQLARAERTYSSGFASNTQSGLFGTGTFSISVGADAAVDITVDGTDTLQSVASKINASDARVSAAVIFDGTEYRLQVSGEDTGADNAIEFSETGTTLGLTLAQNEMVTAQDAVFDIDGLSMTRSTNLVADAIPGVTLDLLSATSSPITVEVDRNSDETTEKVQEFVDAFNEVARGINAEFVFAGEARVGDSLSGDSMLRYLQRKLGDDIVNPISGTTSVSHLAELGIRVQNDGTLELDEAEFQSILASDPAGVVEFLAGDESGSIDGFVARLTESIDSYAGTAGVLSERIDSMSDQVDDLDGTISGMEVRIGKFEETLKSKFSNLELTISQLNAQQQQMASMLASLPQIA